MADLLQRRKDGFVLWRATGAPDKPELVIGEFREGAPRSLINPRKYSLQQDGTHPDLWSISAKDCSLTNDTVYHYWFEINDTSPERAGQRTLITDPLAYTVDWRLCSDISGRFCLPEGGGHPAAVILYRDGQLVPCDCGGEVQSLDPIDNRTLPPNNQMVIYEMPTAWARIGAAEEREIGVGTFRDVLALLDPAETGSAFKGMAVTRQGRSYLTELGVNALELLPPADSYYTREWGYGTTNFLAPDYDLGLPSDCSWSVPNRDLKQLVAACHGHRLRVIADVVMAFSKFNPYRAIAGDEFFIFHPKDNPSDPDAHNSRGNDPSNFRDGFGSDLFRYAMFLEAYDPLSGNRGHISPGQKLMFLSLRRWMRDFHIDGIRMDSVENVANWDFIRDYRNLARNTWKERDTADGNEARFLVIGEELQGPLDLVRQQRLDALWHDKFREYIRAALLGRSANPGESFESTLRKAVDCRLFGYNDASQAVIYITAHDVEGVGRERLYNYFSNCGLEYDAGRRIKLGFVCLLTAVGVPMILAGEEFADQHDRLSAQGWVANSGGKQTDPVNYSRLDQPWRTDLKNYVARLIKLRTTSPALAVNDTDFIHVDFDDGKRVLAWRRGVPGSSDVVVVVANFSDFGTANPSSPQAEYVVPNWPHTPDGKQWKEVTLNRVLPPEWVGREPLYPWEAKVYTLEPKPTM